MSSWASTACSKGKVLKMMGLIAPDSNNGQTYFSKEVAIAPLKVTGLGLKVDPVKVNLFLNISPKSMFSAIFPAV